MSSSPPTSGTPALDRERLRGLVAEAVRRVTGEPGGGTTGATTAGGGGGSGAPAAVGGTATGATTRAPASPGLARWVPWTSPAGQEPAPAPRPPLPRPTGGRPGKPVVAVGADHGAFVLKEQLARYLREELGHPVIDCGAYSTETVDYPDLARAVARAVAEGAAWRGIVLDAMGIGSTMAANKVHGVRCALCHDEATAVNAREHNDANVLALGSRVVNPGLARALVRLFLRTPHAGGRHARRVAKIQAIEGQQRAAPARSRA